MGMYTGLRGVVILKSNSLVTDELIASNFIWKDVKWSSEAMDQWIEVGRCNFIPNGAVCYMPSEWGEHSNQVEGKRWSFTCSLKNYEGEIQQFINTVLPEIADDWALESLYEESPHGTLHRKGEQAVEINTYKMYDDYTGEATTQLPDTDVFKLI